MLGMIVYHELRNFIMINFIMLGFHNLVIYIECKKQRGKRLS